MTWYVTLEKLHTQLKKFFFNKNMVTVYCGSSCTGKFLSDD